MRRVRERRGGEGEGMRRVRERRGGEGEGMRRVRGRGGKRIQNDYLLLIIKGERKT